MVISSVKRFLGFTSSAVYRFCSISLLATVLKNMISFRPIARALQLHNAAQPVGTTVVRGFAASSDPLDHPKTDAAQNKAEQTDQATQDSVSAELEKIGSM